MLHHRYFCLCHSGGVIKMQEGKSARKTTSYRIDTETFQLVQKLMPEADCRSFQEFGDKAIAHYIEFLLTKKTNPYLTQSMREVLRPLFIQLESELRRANQKLYIASAETLMSVIMMEDYDPSYMQAVHYAAMRAVKKYNGPVTLEQAQKALDEVAAESGAEECQDS